MDSFTFSIISLVVVALFYSGNLGTTRVPAIYVFGDSLADVGNNNYLRVPLKFKSNFRSNGIDYPGRVPTGRFSNGFNSIDYVAMNLGFKKSPPPYLSIKNPKQMRKGVNFASAGSGVLEITVIDYPILGKGLGNGTLSMATQVNYYANTVQALEEVFGGRLVKHSLAKALFYIVTANNDMFEYYAATGAANSTANAQFISNLVDEFLDHLTMLYKLGARKFAITGTGSLGCVPYLRNLNPTGDCIDALNRLSVQFNAVAMPRVQQLSYQLDGFRYSYAYNLTGMVSTAPEAIGFKELKSACCGAGRFNGAAQCTPNATYCLNRTEYIFWDWFHPTQYFNNLTAHFQFCGSTSQVTPMNLKQLVES